MLKKFLSLALILLMLVSFVSCEKRNHTIVSTTPSASSTAFVDSNDDFPTDKTVAEILCDYFAKLVKENKDLSTLELAELWAEHPYLEDLNIFSYELEWTENGNSISGIERGTKLPKYKSVTVLESGNYDTIFSGVVFELKESDNIDKFISALEQAKTMSFNYSGDATEACILKVGNYAVMVLTTEAIRVEVDNDPNRVLNAKDVIKLVKKAAGIKSVSVIQLNLSDEYNLSQVGISSANLIENIGALCEPNMGFGFSLSMVKAKNEADAPKLVKEMESGLNPNKWVCTSADKVLVVSNGKYVLGIMATAEKCETISKAFLEMNFDN